MTPVASPPAVSTASAIKPSTHIAAAVHQSNVPSYQFRSHLLSGSTVFRSAILTGAAENANSSHAGILNLDVEAEMDGAEVALDTASVHTPTMTLKNAALLALIGTILMTVLLVWTFVLTFLNVLRGVVPAVTLFLSLVYAFGSLSVMAFFYVFNSCGP